jgi:hypothetical protein
MFMQRADGMRSVILKQPETIDAETEVATSSRCQCVTSQDDRAIASEGSTDMAKAGVTSSGETRTTGRKTLSLCYSLHTTDQVSHPYKTTDRMMVLYSLTFTFLDSMRYDKRLNLMVTSITRIYSVLNLFMNTILIC